MATKTIGSGGDYATPALWFADGALFPDPLTADQRGEVLNSGEIVVTASQALTIGDAAGHTVVLTTQAGASFVDNANKLTNALRYNASNGAAIRLTTSTGYLFNIQCPNFTMSKLQLKKDTNYAGCFRLIDAASTGCVIDQCILEQDGTTSNTNYEAILRWRSAGTVQNTLVIGLQTGAVLLRNEAGDCNYYNLTLVALGGTTGCKGFNLSYGTPVLKNIAVYGVGANDFNGTASASSSNNATDQAAFGGTNYGASGQTSLVGTTEWQSVTGGSEDLRVKSGAVKLPNGTSSGVPTTDIVGTARSGTYTIGAWQLAAAAVATFPLGFFDITPGMKPPGRIGY